LPHEAWPHALALAGMQAAGVGQCRMELGPAKQVAAGHAAQAGLAAAQLAAAGVTGPLSILEGAHGWLQAIGSVCDEASVRQHLIAPAEEPWRMHEVSVKPWPACRHVHPTIACALQAHALAWALCHGDFTLAASGASHGREDAACAGLRARDRVNARRLRPGLSKALRRQPQAEIAKRRLPGI
jgi:hypothetical protein